MGVAPENQCHAFVGRLRFDGNPQPTGLRECGSCATDGWAVILKPALIGAGFSFFEHDSANEPETRPIEIGGAVGGAPTYSWRGPKPHF